MSILTILDQICQIGTGDDMEFTRQLGINLTSNKHYIHKVHHL